MLPRKPDLYTVGTAGYFKRNNHKYLVARLFLFEPLLVLLQKQLFCFLGSYFI